MGAGRRGTTPGIGQHDEPGVVSTPIFEISRDRKDSALRDAPGQLDEPLNEVEGWWFLDLAVEDGVDLRLLQRNRWISGERVNLRAARLAPQPPQPLAEVLQLLLETVRVQRRAHPTSPCERCARSKYCRGGNPGRSP